jgi:hypothetical protein
MFEYLTDKVGCLFGHRPIVVVGHLLCDRCRRELGVVLDLTSTDEVCFHDG